MWFYQNPPPLLSGGWKWLVSEAFSVSRKRVVPNIFQTIAQYKIFYWRGEGRVSRQLLPKIIQSIWTTFVSIFWNNWVDKTEWIYSYPPWAMHFLLGHNFSVSFLSKSSTLSWVCPVFSIRLVASLSNVMVVSDHTAASSLTWPTVVFHFFVTFLICLVW